MHLESLPEKRSETPRVKFFGVGNAGLALLGRVHGQPWAAGACTALHTSAKALAACEVPRRVLLGEQRLHGLGCGGDAVVAQMVAEEERPVLTHLCEQADLVFILTGLGGGAGTGITAVLAGAAREAGALVIVLAALPFAFEGARRQEQARTGLAHLKQCADVVMCLPNQKCARLLDKATLPDTFALTNQMAADAVRSISQMVTHPGLINLDFAYLYSVLRGKDSECLFAVGRGSGELRVQQAVELVVNSPLLDGGKALAEATSVIVSIASGPDLTVVEIETLMTMLDRRTGDAQVVVGATVDPALQGQLEITVLASSASTGALESNALVSRAAAPPSVVVADVGDTSFFSAEPAARPPSRFVPPPPSLSPEQTERIYKQQLKRTGRKTSASRMQQGTLPLEIISRGRFDKTEPTILQGEDLDIPTFVRRGLTFN